jgi:hypothetical protein
LEISGRAVHAPAQAETETMSEKQIKSQQELTEMIMERIRQHPEWNDIMDVAITRPAQVAPHLPNWDAAFVMNGHMTTPEGAFRIARELGNKYDLVAN